MECIKSGLDRYMDFIRYYEDADENKVLKKVKTRTNFVSCALFFTYAYNFGGQSWDLYKVLYNFFSGKPSTSDEYNRMFIWTIMEILCLLLFAKKVQDVRLYRSMME